jgi:hypothetical protein
LADTGRKKFFDVVFKRKVSQPKPAGSFADEVAPYGKSLTDEEIEKDEKNMAPQGGSFGASPVGAGTIGTPRPGRANNPSGGEAFGRDLNARSSSENPNANGEKEENEDEDEDPEDEGGNDSDQPKKKNPESENLENEALEKAQQEETDRVAKKEGRSDLQQPDPIQSGHMNAEPQKPGAEGQKNGDTGDDESSQKAKQAGQEGTPKPAAAQGNTAAQKVGQGAKTAGKAVSKVAAGAGRAIMAFFATPPGQIVLIVIISIILIAILVGVSMNGSKKQNALNGTGGAPIETRPISDDDALTKLLMLSGDAKVQTEISDAQINKLIAALDVAIADEKIGDYTVPDGNNKIPLKDALTAVRAKFTAASKLTDANQKKTDLQAAIKSLQALAAKLNTSCLQLRSSTFSNVAKANDKLGLLTGWFVRKDGAKIPADSSMCQFFLFVEESKADSLLKENGVSILQLSSIVGAHDIYVTSSMNSKNAAINASQDNICVKCETSYTPACDKKYNITYKTQGGQSATGSWACIMSQHATGHGVDINNLNTETAEAKQKSEAFGRWVIQHLPELNTKKILIHQLIIGDREWVRDNVDKTDEQKTGPMTKVAGHTNHTHIGFGKYVTK